MGTINKTTAIINSLLDTVSSISKTTVGLGNVDNTSDLNKPISTATQTALDLKANAAATQAALDLKANISALPGSQTNGAVTTGTDTTQLLVSAAQLKLAAETHGASGSSSLTPSGDTSGVADSAAVVAAQAAGGVIAFGPGIHYLKNLPLAPNCEYVVEAGATLQLAANATNMFVAASGQIDFSGFNFSGNGEIKGNSTVIDIEQLVLTTSNHLQVSTTTLATSGKFRLNMTNTGLLAIGNEFLVIGTEDGLLDGVYTISAVTANTFIECDILQNDTSNKARYQSIGTGLGVHPKFNTSTGLTGWTRGIIVIPLSLATFGGDFIDLTAIGGAINNFKFSVRHVSYFRWGIKSPGSRYGVDQTGLMFGNCQINNTQFYRCAIGARWHEEPNINDVEFFECVIGHIGTLNDAHVSNVQHSYCFIGHTGDWAFHSQVNSNCLWYAPHFFGIKVLDAFFGTNSRAYPVLQAKQSLASDKKELGILVVGDNVELKVDTNDGQPSSLPAIKFTYAQLASITNGINRPNIELSTAIVAANTWAKALITSSPRVYAINAPVISNIRFRSDAPGAALGQVPIDLSATNSAGQGGICDKVTLEYNGTGAVLDINQIPVNLGKQKNMIVNNVSCTLGDLTSISFIVYANVHSTFDNINAYSNRADGANIKGAVRAEPASGNIGRAFAPTKNDGTGINRLGNKARGFFTASATTQTIWATSDSTNTGIPSILLPHWYNNALEPAAVPLKSHIKIWNDTAAHTGHYIASVAPTTGAGNRGTNHDSTLQTCRVSFSATGLTIGDVYNWEIDLDRPWQGGTYL